MLNDLEKEVREAEKGFEDGEIRKNDFPKRRRKFTCNGAKFVAFYMGDFTPLLREVSKKAFQYTPGSYLINGRRTEVIDISDFSMFKVGKDASHRLRDEQVFRIMTERDEDYPRKLVERETKWRHQLQNAFLEARKGKLTRDNFENLLENYSRYRSLTLNTFFELEFFEAQLSAEISELEGKGRDFGDEFSGLTRDLIATPDVEYFFRSVRRGIMEKTEKALFGELTEEDIKEFRKRYGYLTVTDLDETGFWDQENAIDAIIKNTRKYRSNLQSFWEEMASLKYRGLHRRNKYRREREECEEILGHSSRARDILDLAETCVEFNEWNRIMRGRFFLLLRDHYNSENLDYYCSLDKLMGSLKDD